MNESNNVKFVENKGKWVWKRYDEQGSVTFRSAEFDTEQEARTDFEANGEQKAPEAPASASAESAENTSAPAPETASSEASAPAEQASSN